MDLIVEDLLKMDQYTLYQNEKEKILVKLLKDQLINNIRNNENIKNYYKIYKFNPQKFASLLDIPAIPVNLFKKYNLRICKEEDVVRILNSSSTSTGTPSVITLDKKTAARQKKGLISILKSILGKERKPYLIIDVEDVNKSDVDTLTARGAAIRGIANFSRDSLYVMKQNSDGSIDLNIDELENFHEKYQNKDIIAFGFTFMVWTSLVEKLIETGKKYYFDKMVLLHSGGWKKLENDKVSKDVFSNTLSDILGIKKKNIIDFYGMVEQVGIIYPDCEEGYKHVPNFGDIIIRNLYTLKEAKIGERGLIQTISVLPTSYPGQALLTEDIGELVGVDDCLCGRKGKYFVFRSRAEKAEIRGCGDTFAQRMVNLGR